MYVGTEEANTRANKEIQDRVTNSKIQKKDFTKGSDKNANLQH